MSTEKQITRLSGRLHQPKSLVSHSSEPEKRNNENITVVLADDTYADLLLMAKSCEIIFQKMGYQPQIIPCTNIAAVTASVLTGGLHHQHADVFFSDGGYLGDAWKLPDTAPVQSRPAKGVNNQVFTSGPWILAHLHELGFVGPTFFVTGESRNFITQFQGWQLGRNIFPKEFFFPQPETFIPTISGGLYK